MGRIEADIALESWLFGCQLCSRQGQFTLLTYVFLCCNCVFVDQQLINEQINW